MASSAALAERTTRFTVDRLLSVFERRLLGSTSVNQQSPFAFGVAKARQFSPKAKIQPASELAQGIGFGISEARERLRGFIDGTFNPKLLPELMAYLKDQMLRLETRRSREGVVANYLVDLKSQQSILASSVDRRLSRPGIARTYGKTLEAEAEALGRRIQRSPEMVLAHALRNENAGRLLSADGAAAPFDDWDDMVFSSPAMFGGREVAQQGAELWLGHVYARSSGDPAENLRVMAKAKAEGVKLIYPAATREDAAAGRFIPGMPVLRKENAVRASLVDRRFDLASMSAQFGGGLRHHYEEMHRKYSGRVAEAAARAGGVRKTNVVDLEAFRSQFAAPRPVLVEAVRPVSIPLVQPRRAAAEYSIRHEIGENGRERLVLIDHANGAESPFDQNAVPAGRYLKEDGFGLPSGYLVVDADGGYSHLDQQERYHNTMGAAFVPPKGSSATPRYAIEGEFVSGANFASERDRSYGYVAREAGAENTDVSAPVRSYRKR